MRTMLIFPYNFSVLTHSPPNLKERFISGRTQNIYLTAPTD